MHSNWCTAARVCTRPAPAVAALWKKTTLNCFCYNGERWRYTLCTWVLTNPRIFIKFWVVMHNTRWQEFIKLLYSFKTQFLTAIFLEPWNHDEVRIMVAHGRLTCIKLEEILTSSSHSLLGDGWFMLLSWGWWVDSTKTHTTSVHLGQIDHLTLLMYTIAIGHSW